MPEIQPGEVLLGKYRVEEVIGVGGMGRVVRADHLYLQQPVAIKILLPQMAESSSTAARFLREAQATSKLRSEHIARVMDSGTLPDGVPYMVMEYLEGYDLNQILRHHGPQMAPAVVDLMLQAAEGIAEAHALGIVHRDIKPSNFFITRRPDGSNLLKILDFGISKAPAELSELTGTQTIVGTPTYMAPEQMRTARSTDPRSDIWSMGVVMYQMLAGRPPFEAESYAELVLKVGTEPPAPMHVALPAGLDTIVMRCLEKDPRQRIQNVGELARMLAPYASAPLAGQQSAERTARILSGPRGSQPGFPLAGNGAGLGLMPPALTPRSWTHEDASSVSGSAGQFGTQVVRSGRGWVIASVAGLCVVAGTVGFLLNGSRRGGNGAAGPGPATTMGAAQPAAVAPVQMSAQPAAQAAAQPAAQPEPQPEPQPQPQPASATTASTTATTAAAKPASTTATTTSAKPAGTTASTAAAKPASTAAAKPASTTAAASHTTAKPHATAKPHETVRHATHHAAHHATHPSSSDDLFDTRR